MGQGNNLLAEAILAGAGSAQSPSLREVKVEGIKHKKKWVARCVNKRDLIHAVATQPELTDALEVNLKWLGAKATEKEGALEIPGITFELEETTEVRLPKEVL
jgi:hypothetical protein